MKKILISLSTIALVASVGLFATRAYFTSTATSTGNTFTAGTLNLAIAKDSAGTPVNGWLASQDASWNFSAMAPGATPSVSSVWLKNIGTIDGLHLGISAGNTETVTGFEKQVRVTSLTLGGSNLLTGGAGATIDAYVAPTNCDVTVSGTRLSLATTNSGNSGKVVCVALGDYNATWETVPQISVTYPMTIVSTQGPSVTTSIPFNVTATGVTIRGFSISAPAGTYGVYIHGGAQNVAVKDNVLTNIGTSLVSGGVQAIDLEPGSAGTFTGYTFTGNTITNIGNVSLVNASAKGIYIGDSTGTGTISGVTIQNNIISNVQASPLPWASGGRTAYGILSNYGTSATVGDTGLIVKNNSISNLSGIYEVAIGLEGPTPNASVTLNDIHDIGSASAGVNIEIPNTIGDVSTITINQNNFTPNVVLGISNKVTVAVNGQNNWWGDQNPSDQIYGSVNTAGFLGGPVAGLINGTDQNGNGYADLQDLRLTPITNAGAGLNAGQQKQLVMGVQVDGPTTLDFFQGAGLTTTLTFTLTQQ